MLNIIIAGLSWGLIGGGLLALGGWALARRLEQKEAAESAAFDRLAVEALREHSGGGILSTAFVPSMATPQHNGPFAALEGRSFFDPTPLGMSLFDTPEQQRVARAIRSHKEDV